MYAKSYIKSGGTLTFLSPLVYHYRGIKDINVVMCCVLWYRLVSLLSEAAIPGKVFQGSQSRNYVIVEIPRCMLVVTSLWVNVGCN